ncbi:transcriptional regulator, ArsR family [Candidatus Vecturithrix granuli]|uniref:Transcriptional regulator, ArsR family n=1 Tax=Vecturithrix granuli TaxID=1499967 RepID=A0A081BZI5_VECG1|nr:transcriptional regulator, ArsR family [Candidatus Vecturithrix granuli]
MLMTTEQTKTQIAEELVDILDSAFFKTLSEPVRVQILKFLLLHGRSDIGTIAEQMPQDRSVISRHLNLMHTAGILTCEKETRHIYYAIDAQAFLEKVEGIADKLRACMLICCPDCCRKE